MNLKEQFGRLKSEDSGYETYEYVKTKKGGYLKESWGRPYIMAVERNIVLQNADESVTEFDGASISFRCFERFEGPIQNVDFEIIEAHEEKISYRKKSKSPGPGFVWIKTAYDRGGYWHRSPEVLIRFKGKRTYDVLFGVDDDQYFGCELPELCDSIESAKTCLIPKHIRNTEYDRQGEWFIVKSAFTPQELGYESIRINYNGEMFVMPLMGRNRTNESNDHVLTAKEICWVDDSLNINEGRPILMFSDFGLDHEQHPTISYKEDWYFALENRAIRSFSEEGVD
jgi:hypothetical protein